MATFKIAFVSVHKMSDRVSIDAATPEEAVATAWAQAPLEDATVASVWDTGTTAYRFDRRSGDNWTLTETGPIKTPEQLKAEADATAAARAAAEQAQQAAPAAPIPAPPVIEPPPGAVPVTPMPVVDPNEPPPV